MLWDVVIFMVVMGFLVLAINVLMPKTTSAKYKTTQYNNNTHIGDSSDNNLLMVAAISSNSFDGNSSCDCGGSSCDSVSCDGGSCDCGSSCDCGCDCGGL